jgi:hypothetical protein
MATVLKQYAFYIIPSDDTPPTLESTKGATAVDAFLTDLLTFLNSETSVRKFYFPTDREPEARAKLLELPESKLFKAAVAVLAKRLHEKQQDAEHGSIKVQLGDLLTVFYELDGRPHILLAKLEQVSFLSRGTWQRDSGFPFEKNRLLKTCLGELTKTADGWEIGELSIYDSNSPISRFWWHDFLELLEVTDDARNSHRAHAAWKNLLETTVRPKSMVDYYILRNMVGYYFRNPQAYVHKEAVKSLLRSYKPEDTTLEMSSIIAKAEKLPKQSQALDKQFDEQFTIDPKACNIRIRPIKLTDEIDLVIRKPVEHLAEVVKPATMDGKEGVFVVSAEGYRQFSPSQPRGDGED